jgi:peptidoglycan hydrolase-like protein with peptidoglycan-binding domain
MPRVFQVKSSDPKIQLAYTVEQAVGAGCPNARADVLLVQHLLAIAWIEIPASKGFRPPGETGPLKVDGIFGPVTARFIKFFQEEARRRGANCAQDSRVDPVVTGKPTGSVTGTFYTILALNAARYNRQAGNMNDISLDPRFPGDLRKHFYIDWG